MKKKFKFFTVLTTVILSVSCLLSCSSDDSDKATEGTWYLVSYGSSNIDCTWGEFITFSTNEMVWGLRDRGTSSSYFKYSCDGSKIKCVALDGSDDITFTVKSISGDKMTTTSTDNIERRWRR